jgi:hypothetical protein
LNKKIKILLITSFACCFQLNVIAQSHANQTDLSKSSNFQVINRNISILNEQSKVVVHLDAREGAGVAWLNNTTFDRGVIEFDEKGKNVVQQSFVGIAFHGMDDSTYDCIYFRPFNFQSDDTSRKNHSVQYISMPRYDWYVLRKDFPDKYENALKKNIEPDEWLHVKIIVTDKAIEVYVNGDNKPSLVVKPISRNTSGKIGFWVGNNSDGNFSNLIIKTK